MKKARLDFRRAWRARMKQSGRCTNCGQPREAGYERCYACRVKRREGNKLRMRQWRAAGKGGRS